MPKIYTLDDVDVQGKRVLVRADLNAPLKDGKVSDTTRLERVHPTLVELMAKKAKVVLISHLGRPKGHPDPQFSLLPIANTFRALYNDPINFAAESIGSDAKLAVHDLKASEIVLHVITNCFRTPG